MCISTVAAARLSFSCGHPAFKTFLLDPNNALEEVGEIPLSLLSNKMLRGTKISEYLALLKEDDFVGTGGELIKIRCRI